MIRIRISDPRSFGSGDIKGTNESFHTVDWLLPLMCCDWTGLGSMILIQIIPIEFTLVKGYL